MLSNKIFTRFEKLQPNIAIELQNMIQVSQQTTDAPLLMLCTGYIDAALRNQTWSPPERGLSKKEQAFIAFTEQFICSVGTISDEQVEALREHASADEIYDFVNTLYVTDMERRLEMVAGSILV